MLRIGLTGGVGSGKSTVSQMLRDLEAFVIDADKLGHQSYLPRTPGFRELVAEFGQQVVAEDGTIDRRTLGGIVFGDPAKLKRLEEIVQPRIVERILALFEDRQAKGLPAAVVEAAVLIEAGWDYLVDQIWVTTAPEDAVVERLASRDGLKLSPDQARERIRAQMPIEEKARRAHTLIRTDCTLDETRAQVEAAWNKLLAEAGRTT